MISGLALGQETDSVNASISTLPNIYIIGTPIQDELQRIPAAINVITQTYLQRGNTLSVENEMNKAPGVQMQQGALNTSRITIRGIGSRSPYSTNRIKAYLDGIPLTTAEGETSLEDIDLNLIDRIEIIKGPNSSMYGAGLGGVINLDYKKPLEDVTGFDFNFSGGSFGYFQRGVTAFTSSYKSFIKLGYNELDRRGYRDNGDYDRKNISLYAKHILGKKTSLSLFGLYTRLKAYIPSSLNKDDFNNHPDKAAFTWNAAKGYESYDKIVTGLSLSHQFSPAITNKTSVFLNYRDGYEPRPFDILDEDQTALGARTAFNFLLSKPIKDSRYHPDNRLAIGAEYYNENYTAKLYENLYEDNEGKGSLKGGNFSTIDQNRNYLNAFAQLNLQLLKTIKIDAGVNLNTTHYELEDKFLSDGNSSGSYDYDTQFSPRVGLTFEPVLNKFVYATASHGFSIPTVAETLTPEGEINPSIKPETGWNYEIGVKASWFNNRLYTELASYTLRVENLLVAERIAEDRYVGVNAGKTEHNGIEFQFNYRQPLNDAWELYPYGSFTLNDHTFKEFVNEGVNYNDKELTGVPKNTLNFGLEIAHDSGLDINLNLRSMGKIPLDDANSVYADAYQLLNLRIDYGFGLSDLLNGSVFGGINNLLDTDYAAQVLPNAVGFGGASPRYYYPGDPINFYVGIHFEIR